MAVEDPVAMRFSADLPSRVLSFVQAQTDWPAHFVVCFGGLGPYSPFQVVIGLERDHEEDLDTLRWRVEGAFPGEVLVRVFGRTAWERGAIELDTVLLDAFQMGRVLHDAGEWASVMAHFQALADRGLVVKTRIGWRRPGDVPRDPDAELIARLFDAIKPRRRRAG